MEKERGRTESTRGNGAPSTPPPPPTHTHPSIHPPPHSHPHTHTPTHPPTHPNPNTPHTTTPPPHTHTWLAAKHAALLGPPPYWPEARRRCTAVHPSPRVAASARAPTGPRRTPHSWGRRSGSGGRRRVRCIRPRTRLLVAPGRRPHTHSTGRRQDPGDHLLRVRGGGGGEEASARRAWLRAMCGWKWGWGWRCERVVGGRGRGGWFGVGGWGTAIHPPLMHPSCVLCSAA